MAANANSQNDVIIVGAGATGLCAGALLSRAGLRVTILEEQPNPGGYLQGFSRRGFTFDTAIQWLNNCGPKDFVSRILEHVGDGFEPCKPLPSIRRYKGDSFDYLLTRKPQELQKQLEHDFPKEQEGIARFFEHAQKLGRKLPLLDERMRSVDSRSVWNKTGFGLSMLAWYLPLRKIIRARGEEGLARYFDLSGAGRIFCAEEQLMSAMVPVSWGYSGDCFAPPPGGSQVWMARLREHIETLGSQVKLNTPVTKVLLDKGRAAGVVCASGQEYRAPWLIWSGDLESLYQRALPPGTIAEKIRRKQDQADLYYSNLTVFLGLAHKPEELGLGQEITCLTRDHLSREQHSSGQVDTSALIVLAPSARDSSLAPEGKGTLTIHCPAWLDHHGRWKTEDHLKRGPEYRAFKTEQAQKMIARVEASLAPGLRDMIQVQEIATPVTYWRYTKNRQGSIMGQKPTDKNIKNRLAAYKTSVPGLLLAGHWAEYGGGLPMAFKSAANTSLMILAREHKQAFAQLRRVVDGR